MNREKGRYVRYFEKIWNKNKAAGLAAQVHFKTEFDSGAFKRHSGKLFPGCWLTSPKSGDFYKFRLATFVHGRTFREIESVLDPADILGERSRPFYALSEFMDGAGISVSYALAMTESGAIDFDAIMEREYSGMNWRMFLYKDERLKEMPGESIFSTWGTRGRPTYARRPWDNDDLKKSFANMSGENLEGILLNELFYTGYMKSILKKPTNDPYDVDGFIISLSQKHILPIEIKEKFPVLNRERYFGLDAGRILMLLRLCVPNDTNALYVVREMTPDGRFVGWKYITLSSIIMKASWNLVAGGAGMHGGDTQTVKIPYDEFDEISESTFEEGSLREMANLPGEVRRIARDHQRLHKERFA